MLGDSGGQLEIYDLDLAPQLRFVGAEVGELLGGGIDTGHLAHGGGVRGLALVESGQRLLSVSGSLDKTDRNELRLWDAETGEELRRIRQRPAPYVSLDATPDGAVWIAGTTEGVVEVWARVE